jgi:hypothetical protein
MAHCPHTSSWRAQEHSTDDEDKSAPQTSQSRERCGSAGGGGGGGERTHY